MKSISDAFSSSSIASGSLTPINSSLLISLLLSSSSTLPLLWFWLSLFPAWISTAFSQLTTGFYSFSPVTHLVHRSNFFNNEICSISTWFSIVFSIKPNNLVWHEGPLWSSHQWLLILFLSISASNPVSYPYRLHPEVKDMSSRARHSEYDS